MIRIGTWVTVAHPTVIELISKQDFDWVCIDLEHSPVSRVDLQTGIALIQGAGKKAFVRIPENTHTAAKFPLDSGIDGIIIPMVNSSEEARHAIRNCLYPPKGCRGVGLARAHEWGFAFEKHLEKNLNELEIIVQIEHYKAVEEIEEITKIDEVTGVFIGPYDLSGSMGIPGQLEHPKMRNAIERVAHAAKKSNKLLGAHIISPDHRKVLDYEKQGYDFIAFSVDTYFLGQKIREELESLRRELKK